MFFSTVLISTPRVMGLNLSFTSTCSVIAFAGDGVSVGLSNLTTPIKTF